MLQSGRRSTQIFFKKKEKRRREDMPQVQILGVLPVPVSDTGAWPKSLCLCNIGFESKQVTLDKLVV